MRACSKTLLLRRAGAFMDAGRLLQKQVDRSGLIERLGSS